MRDLKVMVARRVDIDIPPNEQQLIYGGKQMEDGKNLSDYPTLDHGATVFLVLRCCVRASRGKMFECSIPFSVSKADDPCVCDLLGKLSNPHAL